MAKLFHKDDLIFEYPDSWVVEQEENDHGWSVSLYSPGTAFMTVALDDESPDPVMVAETVLAALREDYPELDAVEHVGSLAGQPALGHDIQFFSLDLTNTCWTRSFHTSCGTVLVLCQTSDLDLERYEPVLRAISASFRLEDDGDEE